MDKSTVEAAEKAAADKLAEARAQWGKTRQWRHDRWEAIKADPAAATCVFLAGVGVAEAAPWVVKFVAWVVK